MAASLSSVDSAINSCTSVVIVDFYNRLVLGRQTGHAAVDAPTSGTRCWSRGSATVGFGAAGTILAMNVSRIGSLLEIANKLINAFTGPLFGIYLLAMFSRRATATPALVAGIVGIADQLLRRVPDVDRLHVAVDVRAGRDADRGRGDDPRRRCASDAGSPPPDLAPRDAGTGRIALAHVRHLR